VSESLFISNFSMKNDIKKFILNTVCFTLILTIVMSFYILLCYRHSNVTLKETNHIEAILKFKQGLSEAIDEPKLIVLAGSSAAYGVNTAFLESKLNIETINAGSHAGLVDYILKYGKTLAKPGDVIFMPLEYNQYIFNNKNLSTLFNTAEIKREYIMLHDLDYFRNLPLENIIAMITVDGRSLIKK
jgi:hypothetical protein